MGACRARRVGGAYHERIVVGTLLGASLIKRAERAS